MSGKGREPVFPVDVIGQADDREHLSKGELSRLERFLPVQKEMAEQKREETLHALRQEYIRRAFSLVKSVLYLSLLFVAWVGAGWLSLPDAVLVALLTTTCANVIGILLIAFHWLFPKK